MPTKSVTLSSGVVVTVKSVSARLLERYDLAHKDPVPPMREAEAIGGVRELVPDLDNEEYRKILQEHNAKATNDMINMLVEFGLDVTLPDDDSWVRKLSKIGIDVSADDQKLAYVQYIVMNDFINDMKVVVREILTLSGVSEESVQSWAELF